MKTVAEYEKVQVDKELLMEAIKAGALGAGTVFGVDFLLSKFIHNGKLRAILCAAAPIALAMWLKEKNADLAQGIAVGGAGAGLYKIIQAFLYPKMHIPYAGEEYEDYGVIEEVPEEVEETPMVNEEYSSPEIYDHTGEYGIVEEVPEGEEEVVVAQPSYGFSTV